MPAQLPPQDFSSRPGSALPLALRLSARQPVRVAKGTLLYHFHDKNQLLEALMPGYIAHLQARLDAGIERVRAKGYDNLTRERETIAGFIEWYRDLRRQALSYTSFGVSILSAEGKTGAGLKSSQCSKPRQFIDRVA